jgi:hypothetical protein
LKDIKSYLDAYYFERASRLGSSKTAIYWAMKRLGVSYKKTLVHPKANADLRLLFKERINHYQAEGLTLVYLDESGFVHDLPRLYGYAPVGQRCYGVHDWKPYGRTNAIGALIGTGLSIISLFQANIAALIFKSWLLQNLLPKLPAQCIIVMDNAAFHKTADVKRIIQEAGHTLEYLPSYPPVLNPIEKKWAQAKASRRSFQWDINELFQHHSK